MSVRLWTALLTLTLAALLGVWGVPASAQAVHSGNGEAKAGDAFDSDPAGAIELARKTVNAGQLEVAVKALARYVASHPKELEPTRYLGDLYYRQSDLASAERTYLGILAYVNDRETHNRLGGIYAAQDRVAEAIDQFQKSLPASGAYGHLVELHRRLGDLSKFEEAYRRDAEARPSDAAAQYALGSVYRAERRAAEAVVYLQRSLDLAPRACAALSELGSAFLDLDKKTKAIEVLQRCLSLEPNDYAALVNLGDAYIELSQFEKARAALEHANRSRPEGPEALVDLGYLEDVAQHWKTAVNYYLHAIAVDPLARDAYVDLGYDYDEHQLYALAEAAFLKGLSIAPNDGRLHYLLGVTYADQGKRTLARNEYQRATQSDEPEVARAAMRDLTLLN